MGAVTFSLDIRLVKALKEILPLTLFIETGTFQGDTINTMLPYFEQLISIELSEALWKEAIERFKTNENIQILHGNSSNILGTLTLSSKNQSTLYWLDAHWCVATNTSGEQSQCPLLDEIKEINTLNEHSIILIDDARLFLALPPKPHDSSQWPTFNQIIAALNSTSKHHELMVVNDVIIFYPKTARSVLNNYATECGADWLRAHQSLTENKFLRQSLEEKENVIKELAAGQQLSQLSLKYSETIEKMLMQNERIIQSQALTIHAFDSLGLKRILQFKKQLVKIFHPRIGNLNQYTPRPMHKIKKFQAKNTKCPLKISIISPSLEQGQYIEKTINSILNQGYDNLEYFIQDGKSTDNTLDILQRYNDQLSGWISEADEGQSQAINRGFLHTTGDIMGWINSDDILLPDALACVADYFTQHPKIDVVYGNRLLIDENDMEIGRWILPGHHDKVLSWADFIPQETLFWRRSIWEKAGGQIDESFRFAMDWDLLIRFRNAGARFAHIPRFLGAFRIHQHQKTTSIINEVGFQEMDRIRSCTLGRVPSRKEIHKATLPFLLKHVATDITFRVKSRLRGTL